jgi:hypothetical protein
MQYTGIISSNEIKIKLHEHIGGYDIRKYKNNCKVSKKIYRSRIEARRSAGVG